LIIFLNRNDCKKEYCGVKRVLVTGASGFLGSAITERLAKLEDYETVAVISGRHPVSFPANVRVETADLLNETARVGLLERIRPDIMLHIAWGLVGKDFWSSEENMKWLEASSHLCRLFRQYGGSRFLFAGSHTEYGIGYPGRSEREQEKTFTLYGACKLAFEQTAANFCEKNSIAFASGRYFSIYGPRDNRPVYSALTAAIQSLLKGEAFECKAPWNIWDYIYVDDAAEATIRLMESNYCGILNIGSGYPRMMKDVFSEVAKIVGRPELLRLDSSVRGCGICVANTEQMQSILHYNCPTPFREGLEKTVQWWKDKERYNDGI